MIDETNYGLVSLPHSKCRARYFPIITDKSGLSQVGIDLHIDGLDLNPVIVDRRTVRVCDDTLFTL